MVDKPVFDVLPADQTKPKFDGKHAVSRHFMKLAHFISLFLTHTHSFSFYSLSDIFVLIHLKEEK